MNMTTNNTLLAGTVSAHPRGFGFATTVAGDSYFIAPPLMRSLLPGDCIEFELTPGRAPGTVQVGRIVGHTRPETFWLGELEAHGASVAFLPDEACPVAIEVRGAPRTRPGDVILVRIAATDKPTGRVRAQFVRNLGQRQRPGFDGDYALARGRFEEPFADAVLGDAECLAAGETDEALLAKGVADYRQVPFVTVDGASTRDLDDAVYVERSASGYRALVAIADVSYFVRPGSVLDTVARARATSVYLPDRVVPMLPKALSEELCSLVPGESRLALVCTMELDAQGAVRSVSFERGLIRSKARLTYGELQAWRDAPDARKAYPAGVGTSLDAMWALFAELLAARRTRGVQEFEDADPYLTTDEHGNPMLGWSVRTDAHRVIEEVMLLANSCAARQLAGGPGLFRHQPLPLAQDWQELVEQLAARGLTLPATPSLRAVADLLDATREREDHPVISSFVIGAMQPARYHAEAHSHFSLGFEAYAHFTSPIRRYADLVVHRLLLGEAVSRQELEAIAEHCSERSHASHLAERFVWDRIKKRFLVRDVATDAVLAGRVIGQNAFGVRAVLEHWQCVANLDATSLKQQGFAFSREAGAWLRSGARLDEGTMLNCSQFHLEEFKQRCDLRASLVDDQRLAA